MLQFLVKGREALHSMKRLISINLNSFNKFHNMEIMLFLMQGLQKFYDTVLQAILRHVNFEVTRCILLASPGFVKDHFFEYMMQWASKNDNRMLIDNKSKFLLIHASSGFKHSLKG